MSRRHATRLLVLAAWLPVVALGAKAATAHDSDGPEARLARIGPAADFTLTAQDGAELTLADLRGKVVAVNFVFTRCPDVCPIVTAKMVWIQRELGDLSGRDVFFLSVTIDPEHDTPAVLARYARALGCDLSGWAFLTGSPAAVREVARSYGVVRVPRPDGTIEHNLLTTLVDREGTIRVQYMGERFEPRELLHDLRALATEKVVR